MANGRGGPKGRRSDGRDPGGFLAIPWSVTDSSAYMDLSYEAKALLIELARQFVKDNNGRLLLSRVHMATRGWFSAGKIQSARDELLAADLIFQTVLGQRPNKASWYAVTWRRLDHHPGYDAGAGACFRQGAYRDVAAKPKRPPPSAPALKKARDGAMKVEDLIPAAGTSGALIAPAAGTRKPRTVPAAGAMRADSGPLSVPVAGHHLEKPSAGDRGDGVSGGPPNREGASRPGDAVRAADIAATPATAGERVAGVDAAVDGGDAALTHAAPKPVKRDSRRRTKAAGGWPDPAVVLRRAEPKRPFALLDELQARLAKEKSE